ncbi:MAG: DEAD/DEAH box helicase [Alphaproteobacteria bacterium]|nr:DEAD/DEAH box helicase [Alphaproteobacteria bacterium]
MTSETASSDASPQPAAPSFDGLGLSDDILRAIADSGYTTPTPIQAQAIPIVLQGRDVLGIAQTGTGKTASFTVPMIEILSRGRAKARMPRTLILEPTRELAAQVAESFDKYGKYHRLTKALLIGGVSFGDQDALLSQGVDVLIATPGRLLDHFERGKLLLSGVQVMVVDEADRMLDMGFIPDIERIFKLTPFTRQTLFFSATMPPEITKLTDQFLQNPKRIEVAKPATAAATIRQRVVRLPSGDPRTRRAALRATLEACAPITNGIIFCNRKSDVDVVAKSLSRHGFNASPIHGDLDQSLRMKTLDRFKSGDLTLLVASDVAARGLDIPAVGHVFNYEPPRHADDYVHRIGRTGRAGRSGESYTLVARGDEKSLDAIEKLLGAKIEIAEIENAPAEPLGDPKDSGGRGRRAEELRRERDDARRRRKDKYQKRDAERPQASTEPLQAKPARAEKSPETRAAPRQEQRDEQRPEPKRAPQRDGAVYGFGDDTPAFLRASQPKGK